ncbi:hypothetical protein BC826DRAFT_1131001, partial [Russula brevipes]
VELVFSNTGADPTAQEKGGWTSLLCASRGGHVESARFLLERGADGTTETKGGWTPLHLASREGHVNVARIFSTLEQMQVPKKKQELNQLTSYFPISGYPGHFRGRFRSVSTISWMYLHHQCVFPLQIFGVFLVAMQNNFRQQSGRETDPFGRPSCGNGYILEPMRCTNEKTR